MADTTGKRLTPIRFAGMEPGSQVQIEIETPLRPGEFMPKPIPSNFARLLTTFPATDPSKLYIVAINFNGQRREFIPEMGNGSERMINCAKYAFGYPEMELWEQ